MTLDLVYDTSSIFRTFTTGKGSAVSDERCRIRSLPFESAHTAFLHPEDRTIEENRRFTYLMVEPVVLDVDGFDDVLLLTHGLNEGSYAKLFPWAYNLASCLRMPVLIFPMAFHINRRSSVWGFTPQVHLANDRGQITENRKTSPFNARISMRISEAPDRFTREGLQSYYDVIRLCDRVQAGEHPGCRPGAKFHFLGYSAGGYLSLNLMLANPGGRFTESRCVVFASGTALMDMHPASIFIVDTEGETRLIEFLQSRGYERSVFDASVAMLVDEPTFWLTETFFQGSALTARMEALRTRLLAIAGAGDRVITAEGMARNLSAIDILQLPLGIHEFPFTIPDPLTDTYDRRQAATKALISGIRNSHCIGDQYRDTFTHFIHDVRAFLRPDGLM